MRRHRLDISLAAAVCAVALTALTLHAQDEQDAPRPAPRAADGRPDLSGLWHKPLRTNLARGIEPLPFTPEGLRAFNDVVNQIDPTAFCLFPGVPRVHIEPHPMQIVQLPGKVIFLYEFMHNFRVVPTDGREHDEDYDPAFMGHAVGRWEGDTLVVDSIGYTGRTWLDAHGNVHSDALHVIERFRRTSHDELAYEVTIDDPTFYTKPWTAPELTFPLAPPEWRLLEYACTENNKDLEDGLLQPGPLDGSTRDGTAVAPPAQRRR